MGHNKRKTYAKEIEAAWYAVIGFISPFDYVIRYTDKNGEKQIVTSNPNCVLASQISKNGLLKPQAITKSMFPHHFNRDVILFYKSLPNAKLTTGYGKYDKDALALSFSPELEITKKKTIDPKYHVLLIGIDIDCHNGEWHVREVEELIKEYLPNTYWEDSTNGKGRHGYMKIKFINSFGVLETISNCLEKLFAKLNELKNLHGYEAPIDDPVGLPYKLELLDHNPYEKNWTTLFLKSDKEHKFLGQFVNPKSKIWKDYISYLINSTIHHIPEKCRSFPSKLTEHLSEEEIRSTFSKFLSDNSISFPPPTKNGKYYKITYQRAFKLPMFGATASDSSDAVPDMDCIRTFHFLPYYTSSELKTIYNLITKDTKGLRTTSPNDCSVAPYYYSFGSLDITIPSSISSSDSDSYIDPFSIPIPLKKGTKAPSTRSRCSLVTGTSAQTVKTTEMSEKPPLKKKQEHVGNNCACTNT